MPHNLPPLAVGATTNSDAGVSDLAHVYPVIAAMEEVGLPLCVHGEVTPASGVDIFDREPVFVDTVLAPLVARFPRLRVILEHITTKQVHCGKHTVQALIELDLRILSVCACV